MGKFLVELWLDGYDTEEEAELAGEEFIFDQLDMTASSVKVIRITEEQDLKIQKILNGNN